MQRAFFYLAACVFSAIIFSFSVYSTEEGIDEIARNLDKLQSAIKTSRAPFSAELLTVFSTLETNIKKKRSKVEPTLPFMNYSDGRPQIGVVGGGYSGIILSILLAQLKTSDGKPALDIHLFEKNHNLMDGASIAPARLHLGGEYPKDPITAFQCLVSALFFRQMFPTESILTSRKRIDFLLAKASIHRSAEDPNGLLLDELQKRYAELQSIYKGVFDQFEQEWGNDPANCLFGRPEDFFDCLNAPEDIDDVRLRHHFVGGVRTSERGFQPIALGVVLERLLEKNKVHLHLGQVVTHTENQSGEGYKLRYRIVNSDEEGEFFARYVVNAAWHEGPRLTHQAFQTRGGLSSTKDQLPTKVFLRSIGLFDVSGCSGIPTDRNYFRLMGPEGGMVSFFSPTVAIIYVPEEGLSYQGRYDLNHTGERESILGRDARQKLKKLEEEVPQGKVLYDMLDNAQTKYPFLVGAKPITLLTRTTLSWDDEIYQRQHNQANWPLGEGSRWLQAFSTKATFSPLIALQAFGQIVRQPDIKGKVALSDEVKRFLYHIRAADLTKIQVPKLSLIKLPSDFVLFSESINNPKFRAEMQLFALKRHLPIAMVESFSGLKATSQACEQISMVDWKNLENVDLRDVPPTQQTLEALTNAVNSLERLRGFKSFRFRYHSGNKEISPEYRQMGLGFLKALHGRPIDEFEIDQLALTTEEQVKSLTSIILDNSLRSLTLTRLLADVEIEALLKSFFLPLHKAGTLKKVRLSFNGLLDDTRMKIFLQAMRVVPRLEDLNMSNNYMGSILGATGEPYCYMPLEDLVYGKRSLKQFNLSQNGLFTTRGSDEKFPFLDVLKSRKTSLRVNIRQNGLSFDQEREFDPPISEHYLTRVVFKD